MTKINCTFCGRPVDPNDPTVWNQVWGWERRRSQGGTNALALRVPTGIYACSYCISLRKRKVAEEQMELFG